MPKKAIQKIGIKYANAVATGDNVTINQKTENRFDKQYRGEHSELRLAIEHDQKILRKLPPGPARDEFARKIEDRARHLARKSKYEFIPKWLTRTFAIVFAISIVLVGAFFGVPIYHNHTLIANGHPEMPRIYAWHMAIATVLNQESLTSRGNYLLSMESLTQIPGPDSTNNASDAKTNFQIMLKEVRPIKACDTGSTDTLPSPKNGQWALLDFEVHGMEGDISGLSLLRRRDIFVAEQSGPVRDIGDPRGSSCIAETASDAGVTSLRAHQVLDVKIVADVLQSHGYIGFRGLEWRY